jgi:hypothetical protein
MNPLVQISEVSVKVCFVGRPRQSVHSRGGDAFERRAATELHNARLECDWSDGKTIVSKIRPHNAVYCGLDRPLQRSVSLI